MKRNEQQQQLDHEIAEVFDVKDIGVLSNDMKKLMAQHKMGRDEMRFLTDTYYQLQAKRIASQGQIRSIEQNTDKSPDQTHEILSWYFDSMVAMEKAVLKILDAATDLSPTGRWMKKTYGIGPALAANMLSMFDIDKAKHAGHFISYAGLNDNNCPRIGSEAASKIINEAVEKNGLTEETLAEVFTRYGRNWSRYASKCYTKNKDGEPKKFKDGYHLSKTEASKALSIIPYNSDLKKACWKIGQQFLKLKSNPNSKYGKILVQRKQYEIDRNESGENRELAAKLITKYSKTTDAYKSLEQGMLPAAQLEARAERYATKLFVSHLFDCMYIEKYGCKSYTELPEPYVMKYLGHEDYIGPEVPYSDIFPGFEDRPYSE